MRPSRHAPLPPDVERELRRAIRLEWLTIVLMSIVIMVMYLVMGSSQAMKTALVEDLLSLVPPIAFLISVRVMRRPSDSAFPYGYHRVVTIAFLVSTVALFSFGSLLFLESVLKLVQAEHPSVGGVEIFGRVVWLGWLMIAALALSILPTLLGLLKLGPARKLHNKTLYADAMMNKADWLTAMAGILGILGIGLGWWWADSLAAAFISFDILHDGFKHMRAAIADLMDRVPLTVDGDKVEPVIHRLHSAFLAFPWVRQADIRLREDGQVFLGEAFIVATECPDPVSRAGELQRAAYALDWRLREVVIQFVDALPPRDAGNGREKKR